VHVVEVDPGREGRARAHAAGARFEERERRLLDAVVPLPLEAALGRRAAHLLLAPAAEAVGGRVGAAEDPLVELRLLVEVGHEDAGGPAGLLEDLEQRPMLGRQQQRVLAQAGRDRVLAREQGAEAGVRLAARRHAAFEERAAGGQRVDVRRGRGAPVVVAVGAEAVGAQRVEGDDEQVGTRRLVAAATAGSERGDREGCADSGGDGDGRGGDGRDGQAGGAADRHGARLRGRGPVSRRARS
jgi:hypothetical protein